MKVNNTNFLPLSTQFVAPTEKFQSKTLPLLSLTQFWAEEVVFGPSGVIWDPLSAAAPWAICQYNHSRALAPLKFDYFNPKTVFSLFSKIPKGKQNT